MFTYYVPAGLVGLREGYQADTKAIAAPSKRPERIPLPLKDKAYRILLPEQMPGI